jgi:hypothetical protein
MAESWLHTFREELVRMRRDERLTLDQIIAWMERQHQRRMAKSTLSEFFKSLPEMRQPVADADTPRVSPEEQHFLAQAEVLEYVKQTSATLVEAMARLHARQEVLETAAAERHTALLASWQRVEDAVRSLASRRTSDSPPDELGLQVVFEELRRVTQALEALRGRAALPPSAPPHFLAPTSTPAPRRRWQRGLGIVLLLAGGLLALALAYPPLAAWLAHYGSMPWPWLRP